MTKAQPRNPHSSPIVQKIKSVSFAGKKFIFDCVPFKNPFPANASTSR
jgi:hypothetical protein